MPSTDFLEISAHAASNQLNPVESSTATKPSKTEFIWIDCREDDEYAVCRIEGARLLPLSNFAAMMESVLPIDKNQALIVYCHHGMRSLQAVNFLRQKGYPNTWSLSGGIDAWAVEIDDEVPRY